MLCGDSVQPFRCTMKMMSGSLFPASDFDDWADTYDDSLAFDQFPFTGYPQVLTKAVELAEPTPGYAVLDLGTGTGNLALRFARAGCRVWCTDFSERMLERARQKIPGAVCLLHDVRSPLHRQLDRRFDLIVSAYLFHHFDMDEKVRILSGLLPHLLPAARIVIADIAFPDAGALEQVRLVVGAGWEDEFYWLADETALTIEKIGMQVAYQQVSPHAGVFVFKPSMRNMPGERNVDREQMI